MSKELWEVVKDNEKFEDLSQFFYGAGHGDEFIASCEEKLADIEHEDALDSYINECYDIWCNGGSSQ